MSIPRKESKLGIYHVIIKGTGSQCIFEDDLDREKFLDILKASLDYSGSKMYSYVLMHNHVHLILKNTLSEMASCMQKLCGSYARYFNNKASRSGHLFKSRYKSEAIDDESYFLSAIRYIHQNPERAKVSKTQDYKWSSYKEYTTQNTLCATEDVFEIFGSVENFIAFNLNRFIHAEDDAIDKSDQVEPSCAQEIVQYLVSKALQSIRLNDLKSLKKEVRNFYLQRLKEQGLSIRQIQRLTGIGRNIIMRA